MTVDLTYVAKITPMEEGGYLVTFPDVMGVTEGDTLEEALFHAQDCLEEAIAAYISDKEDIPLPGRHTGKGIYPVVLTPRAAAKVQLYQLMRHEGITRAQLAQRLGWKWPQVDRLTNLRHRSDIGQLDAAFTALGKRLVIHVEDGR